MSRFRLFPQIACLAADLLSPDPRRSWYRATFGVTPWRVPSSSSEFPQFLSPTLAGFISSRFRLSRPPPPTLVETRISFSRAVVNKRTCWREAFASGSTVVRWRQSASISIATNYCCKAVCRSFGRLHFFLQVTSQLMPAKLIAVLRKSRLD